MKFCGLYITSLQSQRIVAILYSQVFTLNCDTDHHQSVYEKPRSSTCLVTWSRENVAISATASRAPLWGTTAKEGGSRWSLDMSHCSSSSPKHLFPSGARVEGCAWPLLCWDGGQQRDHYGQSWGRVCWFM